MKTQIKIPAVGESITEATISQWNKKNGEIVKRDEILLTLETDKASVEVVAETAGKLSISVQEGQTVAIGSVVGEIDASAAGEASASKPSGAPSKAPPPPPGASAAQFTSNQSVEKPAPKPQAPPVPSSSGSKPLSPAVKKLVTENQIDTSTVSGTGKDGRLTKGDVLGAMKSSGAPAAKPTALPTPRSGSVSQETTREPMTKIRQTIAKRLVEAQHTAAILTTFNEIDMSNVMALRSKYKDSFEKKHGIKLGFMGFFVKAAIEALKAYPKVNAYIEGTDLIYHHYYNIGMAVGTEKGLLVPIIKNAESLSLAEVEMSIKHYAEKARDGKIALDDLNGGTFTISNGGVYGSLMSTPILNPPQSGILGLHKIEERAVVIDGKIEIRPMMYVALSYDHRVIDGAQSVGFLVKIKECMEDPARILLEI